MIRYNVEKHTYAFPTKVLGMEKGGAHVFNVQLTADTDNGAIIRRGAYLSLDLYEQASASTMKGVIREKATNGNYYVEITENPDHELFVYQKPLINEEYSHRFTNISNFFNGEGEIVRAIDLVVGDMVELSAEGFTGTPVAGKEVTVVGGKFKVAA